MINRISISFLLIVSIVSNVRASNITVTGNVSGNWNVDTVKVISDIELLYNQTLTINPGCKVLFEGFFRFTVGGRLIAKGLPGNMIRFERRDTTGFFKTSNDGAWYGMIVKYSSPYRSEFEYCVFRFLKSSRGGTAIDLEYSNASFLYCQFLYNRVSTLLEYDKKEVQMSQCIFARNYTTNVVRLYARPNDTVYFVNNTIVQNEGIGLRLIGAANSVEYVYNNIFWSNKSSGTNNLGVDEIYYEQYDNYGFDTSRLQLRNCILKDGQKNPVFNNTCFTGYPRFEDAVNLKFGLKWDNYPVSDTSRSIAIDNGYHLSLPDPDSSRKDIGAISFYREERKAHTSVRFEMDTVLGYLSYHLVHFKNLSNVSTMPTTWLWDFGDGNFSADKQPSHVYPE